ncbi:MAG TPA: 4a-hydroxytetrahydrobiopterin dehydratase [Bacteriovoracaceae bacterium]|nr:4a-hydroxytetrahydrobiopterin dehydratase [Bacteriovoracaceae bacterium]
MENWIELDNHLQKTFEFKSFLKTMSFVNAVAWLANKHNHHPQIIIDFNKSTIRLTTHDVGRKVTDKDRQLAQAIDQLFS